MANKPRLRSFNSPLEGESTRSFSASVGGRATKNTPHGFARANPAPPQGGSYSAEGWLDALPLAAMLVDVSGRVTHANAAAEDLTATLRAPQLTATLGEHHPLNLAITRAIGEDRTTHLRDIVIASTPATAWVTPHGAGEALVLLDMATTKEPANYTQLSATMAAMLAHEIRNPLLSIKGAAQLLKESANVDDAPLCELIGKEVDRLEQLIATLDPLSITPPKKMQALNIHEVLEHARLAIATSFPALTFVLDYDPSLPDIRGDRDALVQALLNLLKNAAEAIATMEQPTITLSSRYALGETRRNAAGKQLPVAISVMDNGPGVSPTLEGRLFAPFTTTKTSGKGLGLAVVARIIEEHEGLISSEAAPSGGARFTLYLPTY